MSMRFEIDFTKSVNENASEYYEKSKKMRKKLEGVEKAIRESRKELEQANKEKEKKEVEGKKAKVKVRKKKEWYESYHWFYTSGGKLVIAGRDAKQNDIVTSKYLEENDLWFHADIQGAPATILKGGKEAEEQEKKETAQFAASFSSAWKIGSAGVDVYAVKKGQLGKHAQGRFIGKGGFAIKGAREWFRGTPLGVKVGMEGEKVKVLPIDCRRGMEKEIGLAPGGEEKGRAAREIAKKLDADIDEVLSLLPSGKIKIMG